MYTSAIKTGMRYLAVSIAIAAAAAVYGLFSHGVYSYFMTYAFMIPLIGGALPHLTAALAAVKRTDAVEGERVGVTECEKSADAQAAAKRADDTKGVKQSVVAKILSAKDMQLAVIATLTAGSLLKGVLDIYGTTNRLLLAYPVMAAVVCVVWAAAMLRKASPSAPSLSTEKQ